MLKRLLILSPVFVLSACNYLMGDEGMFRDRGGDYAEAQIIPQMAIPEDLDSYTLDQLYVVPELFFTSNDAFEDIPKPKPIETQRREGVIIQSLAERRWILIDATPGQVWPMIRDYWTSLQIILDYENPSNGIMETAWVEANNDRETRHKYRVIIEPGLHSGYSEIYMLHMENPRTDNIPIVLNWPETSNSPDMERQVMTSVSQYLADRNDVYQASSSSLLAGSIESESKANIVESASGDAVLELKVPYDRAGVQIRTALETAEIFIVDSDRDASFFNVRFAGIVAEEDEPGFIGRLFRSGDNEGDETAKDFSVRLMETNDVINVVTEALEILDEDSQLTVELLQVINDNLT